LVIAEKVSNLEKMEKLNSFTIINKWTKLKFKTQPNNEFVPQFIQLT